MRPLLAVGIIIAPFFGNSVRGVEFNAVKMASGRFTICQVDVRKERLQLFLRDDVNQPFKRFDRLSKWLQARNRKLLFAMNAGMYDRNFSAVGLLVINGQQISPLNTSSGEGNFFLKPNGVFVVSDTGAHIVESSEYPRLGGGTVIATQSGPLLVQAGKIHPAFQPDSKNRLVRNGVGVSSPEFVWFAISETPVNLHEFAALFRDKLHCPDALYLDGVVSSLHSTELKRSDSQMDLGPIIAIIE